MTTLTTFAKKIEDFVRINDCVSTAALPYGSNVLVFWESKNFIPDLDFPDGLYLEIDRGEDEADHYFIVDRKSGAYEEMLLSHAYRAMCDSRKEIELSYAFVRNLIAACGI